MTEPKFPFGYARPADGGPQGMGTMLTWDQMMLRTTVNGLMPEVLDRLYSLIHHAYSVGVPLGVGTGYRAYQPNLPGFAANGNSNHQAFDPPINAVAIDTVPNISWWWMETNAKAHGFRTFRYVNNEPWHIQPAEIPASRNYRKEPWVLQNFDVPIDRFPEEKVVTFTLTITKTELTPENRALVAGLEDTYLFQRIMAGLYEQTGAAQFNLKPDGDYGPKSQEACKTFQALNGLTQDARCGGYTWALLVNKQGKA